MAQRATPGWLTIRIGRDEADGFARQVLAGGLQPGAAIDLWGPQGDFVLEGGDRPLVFAACDLGFAPIRSLHLGALRVANGQGLTPISEELSVSIATVKTHLQHVFDKTDTHRQAELVRLLTAVLP